MEQARLDGVKPDTVVGIESGKFSELMKVVLSSKNAKDDANMSHATAWKALQDRGANLAALKFAFKISRLERGKAQSIIKDLLEYCAHFGVWDQMQLPLGTQHHVSAEVNANDDGPEMTRLSDGEGDADREIDGSGDDSDPSGDVGTSERLAADGMDASEIPPDAGRLFNDGAEAALAGSSRSDHGFLAGSPQEAMWLNGFDSVKRRDDDETPAFLQ